MIYSYLLKCFCCSLFFFFFGRKTTTKKLEEHKQQKKLNSWSNVIPYTVGKHKKTALIQLRWHLGKHLQFQHTFRMPPDFLTSVTSSN